MRIVLSAFILGLVFESCLEEPIWCNATLFLTIQNNKDIPAELTYIINIDNFRWDDSLTMYELDGEKKNTIKLSRRNLILQARESFVDTINYKYYQSDSPCARSGFLAEYMVSYLKLGNDVFFNIYPWRPEIFHESICDGCKNVNHDTISIQ